MSRKNFGLIFVFLFLSFLISTSTRAALVSVDPSTQSINTAGDPVTVTVSVSGVRNLYGFQVTIHYDPAILQFERIHDEGSILRSGGNQAFFSKPATCSSTPGTVCYIGVIIEDVPGVDGQGTLFTAAFKTLATGTSTIELTDIVLSDSVPSAISTDHHNGSITVGRTSISPPVLQTLPALTKQSGITVSGTAEAGSRVEILINNRSAGTTTASGSGSFLLTGVSLSEGRNEITARSSLSGITSPLSSPASIVLDTIAPNPPVITQPASPATEATISVTGQTEPNSTVALWLNSQSSGTSMADSLGNFSFVGINLSEGMNILTARATDAAGNTSAASAEVRVVRNAITQNSV